MEQAPLPKLKELLKPDSTREQFESVATGLLSDNDRKLFGETAKSKLITGILYLAPFAPEPATFDINAYKAVAGIDDSGQPLKDEEVARLVQIAKDTGVIKEADKGRLMLDKDIAPILGKILSQYEE